MFFNFYDFLKDFSGPYIALTLFCLMYIKFVCVNKLISRDNSVSAGKNILILIAHPDDECMFFSPTILGLLVKGHRVFVVCLSKGN